METLQVFDGFDLPINTVTRTIAILASKGKGKSYAGRVFAEEMVSQGVPFAAIDPAGAWYGLPLSPDGRKPSGLPVVVFGGDHGQAALPVHAGKVMGEAIAKKRFAAVFDLSLMKTAEQKEFAKDFFDSMYLNNREAIHLFVDEADEFAPESGKSNSGESLARIVKRGRSKGIGVTMLTQRPADISKSVLTQCEILLAMGMNHPRDIKPILEWVALNSDGEQSKIFSDKLPTLTKGNGWISSPVAGLFKEFHVRKSYTYDSGITPEVGKVTAVANVTAVDVAALSDKIAKMVQENEQNDPAKLRKEIEDLRQELTKKIRTVVTAAQNPEELGRIKKAEYDRGVTHGQSLAVLEYRRALELSQTVMREISGASSKAVEVLGKSLSSNPKPVQSVEVIEPKAEKPSQTKSVHPIRGNPYERDKLGKCEKSILRTLIQVGAASVSRTAVIAGYASSGGGFNNSLSNLKGRGYLEKKGDTLSVTESGIDVMGHVDPLPSGEALFNYWLGHKQLGKAEKAIMTALQEFDNPVDKEAIAGIAGYEANGGGFSNSLSKLKTMGLIEKIDKTYRLHEDLR